MHGVKRLFAWMIPRFDRDRFEVSLVSLRKKDLSEETLDALGIDITYLHKSKFDPATLPALLKIIDQKKIDVLHLHGYGATTFGRMAAAMRGIPAILHEHANLTDTPWFQKVADRVLERYTDIAIAVSKSTADFVVNARLVQPEKVKVVYLGAPHEEFSRPRSSGDVLASRRELGIHPEDFAIGTVTRFHESKGNSYLIDAARLVVDRKPHAKFFLVGEGPLRDSLEAAVSPARSGRSLRVRRVRQRCGGRPQRLRSQRVPVAVGRHPADRLRSAGIGQADRRDRCRRTAGHPYRRARCADRAEAQHTRACRCDCRSHGPAGGARSASPPLRVSRRSATTSPRSYGKWSSCM